MLIIHLQTFDLMKKLLLFTLCLVSAIAVVAQPRWYFARQGSLPPPPDTVRTVSFPDSTLSGNNVLWDFSRLDTLDKIIISTTQTTGNQTDLIEGLNTFHFIAHPQGNYFLGWENNRKIVNLFEPYNKLPYPLIYGRRNSTAYNASGLYTRSGVTSMIDGSYVLEVDGQGDIILPDGRYLCNATRIKTTDSYVETSFNTTTVNIEKHLWYVPYYSFPVFVTVETAYAYSEGGSDTLRTAYYVINAMPSPVVHSITRDTTICLGQTVLLSAIGEGDFFWREADTTNPFVPFKDTLIQPAITTAYILMAEGQQCNAQPAYDTVTVTVEIAPTLFLANSNISHCARTHLYLNATSNVPVRWFERNDYGELTLIEGNLVEPEKTMVYIAQAGNSCLTLTDSVKVSIIPMEAPEMNIIVSGKDVIFDIENFSSNHFYYTLNFGDGSPSDNRPLSLHHYAASGSYTAVLTLSGKQTGCEASFEYPITIDENTGNPMILYPNPANYVLNVIVPSGITFYRIVDVSGISVYNESTRPGNETAIQINITNLPQGQYVLQLHTLNGPLTRVFIKS